MGKRSRKIRQTSAPQETGAASNQQMSHPDATLGPEASYETTLASWLDRDSTSAPAIGKEDEKPNYAPSGFGFLDKFLHGRLHFNAESFFTVLLIAWFIFVSWIFLQDNGAGKLDTLQGFKWFGIKITIYTVFAIPFVFFIVLVYQMVKLWKSGAWLKSIFVTLLVVIVMFIFAINIVDTHIFKITVDKISTYFRNGHATPSSKRAIALPTTDNDH